jgi:hypothetical protein
MQSLAYLKIPIVPLRIQWNLLLHGVCPLHITYLWSLDYICDMDTFQFVLYR